MLNKKWMILSLLIGNVFLISIAMSGPMYIGAVTQNLLTRTLADSYRETGEYPALFTLEASLNKGEKDSASAVEYAEGRARMEALAENMQSPALYETEFSFVEDCNAEPLVPRSDLSKTVRLSIATMTGLEEHCRLIEGSLYSETPDENGVYDVMIGRSAFVRKHLVLGEEFTYQYLFAPDGSEFTVRIAGVFDSTDDSWWLQDESYYASQVFVPKALFDQLFLQGEKQAYPVSTLWSVHLDYQQIKSENVETVLSVIDKMNGLYNRVYIRNFNSTCEEMLRSYRSQANQAAATLTVLQVPIFALLIAFIFMVSRQILEIEQSEISVLKSRGASSGQVMGLYLTQSLILAAVGFAVSVPLSAFLCRAIGSASAFLEFSNPAQLVIRYDLEAMLYAVGAAVLGVLTMVLPAISFARLTIVDAKRSRHALGRKPVWQKFFLDFITLAVSLYGLYSFNNQKAALAERVAEGGALDPLLYISSSLFVVGAALVLTRFIPMLASCVFRLFRKHWTPSLYASFLQILRCRNNQAFMMVFLMLTIAIGILNADTACTVNRSQEEQLRFQLGADVVLEEAHLWQSGEYSDSDLAVYEQLDGVESVTPVYLEESAVAEVGSKNISRVQFMGIDTRGFGETCYRKDGLMPEHFFTYLNGMSQTLNGCLVSANFRDNLGCEVGDRITAKTAAGNLTLEICGVVDYFPTYNPTVRETQDDGTVRAADRYLVVANLGYVKSAGTVSSCEIWIRSPGATASVAEYAAASGVRYRKYADIDTRIDAMKNSPSVQGTNGILTLSFIIGLTLCAAGFLIFWILSIRSRNLQFGIYRAMGMSVGDLVRMLINEHIWQSVTSVIAGAGIGYLVSWLYIPLIQMAYTSADAVLPLQVTRDFADHIRLIVIIAAVLVACVCILIALIRRLRMAQAIKLGED